MSKIPRNVSSTLLKSLQTSTENLFFVRTGAPAEIKNSIYFYISPNETNPAQLMSSNVDPRILTPEEQRKYVESIAEFRIKSGNRVPRRPKEKDYTPDFFYSEDCVEPIFENGEFQFALTEGPSTVPFHTPQEPDLICFINNGDVKKKWFICSEQFMRMWTIIHFDKHPSYPKKNQNVYDNKKNFMSGNRLVTDSWTKYIKACQQNDTSIDANISKERFYNLRTELCGRDYIDIYAALISLAVYGDELTQSNIPTVGQGAPEKANSANQLQRKMWDVDVDSIIQTLKTCGLSMTTEEEQMRRNNMVAVN